MVTIEEMIAQLSDDELRQAFNEILEWRATGELSIDGIVRNVLSRYNNQGFNYPLHVIDTPFLFEISRRHYQEGK
ncbi:hypothetical protein NSQ93_22350 [Bacillus sp. FSL W8-0445]|nr:hypothetical protein [Bacillus licheniformis]GIN25497.1 hypothetical protein J31TS2_20770 [Bacillus licheniformis]GIN29764.1 hypothetical protein J2TS5_18030 [Bacillus licheniformis]